MSAPARKPLVRITQNERARSFLAWAFLISLSAHFLLGGLVRFQPFHEDNADSERISLTPPRAHPTPKPTPPPPPHASPTPVRHTAQPQQRVKLHPLVIAHRDTTSRDTQNPYRPPDTGSSIVVPPGDGPTALPAPTSAPATAIPTPVATQRPACDAPHKDAATTQAISPEYPEIARQQGAVGTTEVKVSLSANGSVLGAAVYNSSGNAALDAAALVAARASSYSPEIEDCKPVAGSYLFRADFNSQ